MFLRLLEQKRVGERRFQVFVRKKGLAISGKNIPSSSRMTADHSLQGTSILLDVLTWIYKTGFYLESRTYNRMVPPPPRANPKSHVSSF